jgi:hypothetical protein
MPLDSGGQYTNPATPMQGAPTPRILPPVIPIPQPSFRAEWLCIRICLHPDFVGTIGARNLSVSLSVPPPCFVAPIACPEPLGVPRRPRLSPPS